MFSFYINILNVFPETISEYAPVINIPHLSFSNISLKLVFLPFSEILLVFQVKMDDHN